MLDNSTYKTSQRQEDGRDVLRLEAVNTTACSSSPRFEIENSSAHVVSIEARVIKGGSWAYCIYSGRSCISKKSIEAPDNDWHKYYFLFDGLPSERGLNLYLYSSQETNDSVVDFRDTSIRTVLSHSLPRFSTTNQEQKTVDVLGMDNIKKLTSSDYKMNLSLPRSGSGVLVFQQSFSPAWHLNIGGYTVAEGSHFTANSYANGWLVDAKDICQHVTCSGSGDTLSFDVTMSFAPQKYGRVATLVSVGVTTMVGVGIASLTLLPIWRKRRSQK